MDSREAKRSLSASIATTPSARRAAASGRPCVMANLLKGQTISWRHNFSESRVRVKSAGEIERQLRMPQPTVSKHLRVLREAGFVESTVDAQRRFYRLKPEPLQEVDAWLAPFRRFWSAHVDALERHLDRLDQSTRTKRKTRRRR